MFAAVHFSHISNLNDYRTTETATTTSWRCTSSSMTLSMKRKLKNQNPRKNPVPIRTTIQTNNPVQNRTTKRNLNPIENWSTHGSKVSSTVSQRSQMSSTEKRNILNQSYGPHRSAIYSFCVCYIFVLLCG